MTGLQSDPSASTSSMGAMMGMGMMGGSKRKERKEGDVSFSLVWIDGWILTGDWIRFRFSFWGIGSGISS